MVVLIVTQGKRHAVAAGALGRRGKVALRLARSFVPLPPATRIKNATVGD
jgi:hypothetical protein